MGRVTDIRIESIMPTLSARWLLLEWDKCLKEVDYPKKKYKQNEYLDSGTYPIIDQGKELFGGFTNDTSNIYCGELPVIIFGDHTRNIRIVNFPFALGADGCKLILTIDSFNRYFFFYYLKCLKIDSDGYSRHYKYLKTIKVPLPPLNEQKRIVEKLDALLPKVKSAKARLEKIPVILKKFRQSVLAAACSGRLTEEMRSSDEYIDEIPIEWQLKPLFELLIGKPRNGYSGKPVKYETKTKVLSLSATTNGIFDGRYFKYLDENIDKSAHCWLKTNDILLQRGNTIEYVGVPAIYKGENDLFIYPDLMIKLVANKKIITPDYLYYYFSWDKTRNYMRENAVGTAGSMPKINQEILSKIIVSVPSIIEQHEIVRRVEKLFALADSLEAKYKKAFTRVEKLEQAILAKAFRGELVEPDPNDLPAAELLKQILAEKEKMNSQKRKSHNGRKCK